MLMNYVLITAARNEEVYIVRTIEAVLSQTSLPVKWVIVSDGSNDGTDDIVKRYASHHSFIDFQRREGDKSKADFASKVYALKQGYLRLHGVDYSLIGTLDADVSFGPSYYDDILMQFKRNPRLGIGGGFIHENHEGFFQSRPLNVDYSVAGAIQLFRRDCYEMIGGIMPSRVGGEDWIAEINALMHGWEVKAFPELVVYHHKSSNFKRGFVSESLRQGIMDYAVGSHPLFEIVKCIRRIKTKPFFVHSILRMYGYMQSWLQGSERVVPPEVMDFLRREQLSRIRGYVFNAKE
jgi:poly-beta-1,6-N-acetyl-D-glucosamine synthase